MGNTRIEQVTGRVREIPAKNERERVGDGFRYPRPILIPYPICKTTLQPLSNSYQTNSKPKIHNFISNLERFFILHDSTNPPSDLS